MKSFAFAVIVALGLSSIAQSSTTYYISPTGSDSNTGTLATKPWKTFKHAIGSLTAGSVLVVEDGTYSSSNSGYPTIYCGSNAKNGTATAPITITAQHERQAFIKGDSSIGYPLIMTNCNYWNVIGLHLESGDYHGIQYADVMHIENSSHILVQRNILAHNNRYLNSHLIDNYNSNHNTFEENELYYFHRHGILDMYGGFNTYRRNYFNSRGYSDISGGYPSDFPTRGDGAIILYPAHDAIIENNISEGQDEGPGIQCDYASTQNNCNNDKFLGNISMGDNYGHVIKARGKSDVYMPHNSFIENDVAISPTNTGPFLRATKNTTCNNCMTIGASSNQSGILADSNTSSEGGDGNYSVYINNSMTLGTNGKTEYGLAVLDQVGSWTWKAASVNAHGSSWNFYPVLPNSHVTGGTSSDPEMGSCLVWIPDNSPLKHAGTGGKDIGADVLKRYQNGVLTTQRLWDPSTGQFPHGAIVKGLNDVAGSSAMDVNKRLHVNTSGCAFPSGY